MARSIAESYARGEAGAFFPLHPASPQDRRRAVTQAVRPLTPAVAEAIERQNARFPPSATRDAHLAALRRGAAAVVTGQQVGLFLGPLFTLYKAAAAIRNARALAEETGAAVVPIFWLQTEDHDLPEIARVALPDREGERICLELPASPRERISIAHRTLPREIDAVLASLDGVIGDLHHGPAHLALLRRHYRPGAGWGEAFAGVLAELLDELVIVDPRDPALAAAAASVHRRALEGAELISRALLRRCGELEAAGFAPAVHVRDGAPLSFFHPEGPAGPRYRLDPAAGGFAEVGGERIHARADLLARLEEAPLSFSTSALLRPILQDTLLPTAAYVGGPGEIAYFAQLAPLYRAFDLPMPLVVPRARFRVLEGRTRRLLERLGLQPDDAARPEAELLARCGAGAGLPEAEAVAQALLAPFAAELDRLRAAAGALPLDRSFARTRRSVERAVERFVARYARERVRSDERLVADVRRLANLLAPAGVPQEREHGLAWYAARYGGPGFVRAILDAVVPFDGTLRELVP